MKIKLEEYVITFLVSLGILAGWIPNLLDYIRYRKEKAEKKKSEEVPSSIPEVKHGYIKDKIKKRGN